MAFHADFAPFPHQSAFPVNQKGAAFYALHLLAVHILQLNHIKEPAQGFLVIRNQIKGKALFGFEILMGFQAIAGNTVNLSFKLDEFGV